LAKKHRLMVERLQNNQATRRGDAYGRGMALQDETQGRPSGDRSVVVNACSRVRARPTRCRCGATDHVKVSFGGCRLNKKNLATRTSIDNNAADNTTMDVAMTE